MVAYQAGLEILIMVFIYIKTGVKRPLKNRQNKDPNDKW